MDSKSKREHVVKEQDEQVEQVEVVHVIFRRTWNSELLDRQFLLLAQFSIKTYSMLHLYTI